METRTQQPVLNLLAGPDVSSQVKRFNKKTLMAKLLRLKDSNTPAPLKHTSVWKTINHLWLKQTWWSVFEIRETSEAVRPFDEDHRLAERIHTVFNKLNEKDNKKQFKERLWGRCYIMSSFGALSSLTQASSQASSYMYVHFVILSCESSSIPCLHWCRVWSYFISNMSTNSKSSLFY